MTRRTVLARIAGGGAAVLGAPMLNIGRCRLYAGTQREYSVRAVDLVRQSLVIDMLGLLTLDWRKLARWHASPAAFDDADFHALSESGITMFNPAVDLNEPDSHQATRRWLGNWNRFLAAHPSRFAPVDRASALLTAKQQGRIAVLLGMQNSDHFRSVEDVDLFYSMGQRLSQLTYNSRNRLGSGCAERQDQGLTELGFEVVERMNALGMIIDVSHAGEQTCMDAFAASSKPVLITHSNCKALMPHPRCKSDEVIKAMADTGGVMGMTCLRVFVSNRDGAGIEEALDHFDHVARVAGIEHIGIGSDSDLSTRGRVVRNLDHPRRIFDIVEGLIRRRYTDAHIELVLGGNFQRAIAAVLG